MPRILACPVCKSKMRVPDDSAGRKTRCPKCSRALRVPAARPAKVAAAKAAPPTVEEVVLSEDQLDVVEEVGAETKGRAPAAPAVEDDVLDLDDVVVVPESTDDLDIVEDEPSAEDDVVVVDDEPEPAAVAASSDPFAGLDVPDDMRQDVQAELTKGEKLVWVGRPSMALLLAQAKAARIAGIVVLVAGVGFLAGIAFASDGMLKLALAVFGVAGLVFGSLMILAPKFVQRGQSKRSVYVLTNRRALIVENRAYGADRVRAYTIAKLKGMQRQDSRKLKGAGDLIFEQQRLTADAGPQKRNHGFLMVENVKAVEKLIRETLVDRGLDKVLAPEQ